MREDEMPKKLVWGEEVKGDKAAQEILMTAEMLAVRQVVEILRQVGIRAEVVEVFGGEMIRWVITLPGLNPHPAQENTGLPLPERERKKEGEG
jgi:hypothetical protein